MTNSNIIKAYLGLKKQYSQIQIKNFLTNSIVLVVEKNRGDECVADILDRLEFPSNLKPLVCHAFDRVVDGDSIGRIIKNLEQYS